MIAAKMPITAMTVRSSRRVNPPTPGLRRMAAVEGRESKVEGPEARVEGRASGAEDDNVAGSGAER
jgi:hypothetical protein